MREPITLPRNPSKSFIAANPQLYAPDALKKAQAKSKMPRSFEALSLPAPGSPLEEQFLKCWRRHDPDDQLGLQRELRFAAPRRWRFDFAWPKVSVAVEVEGGVHSRGRHLRAKGFIADCDKYNSAAFAGYTVFRLPTGGVTEEVVKQIYDFIRRK